MTERRFNEAEVAAIFERAAEAQQTRRVPLASSEGMTLAEIQEIGRDVGIAPEELAQAAKAIAIAGQPSSRYFLGLPIGVGLTVDLDRNLTDQEWERLVSDLRATFDARGKLRQEGSLRQWYNGNLQANVEPTATGHRLRLRTVKGDARGSIGGGLAMLGFAAVAFVTAALRGGFADVGMMTGLATVAATGAAMAGVSAFRLPGWARLRRGQMQEVAARVASLPRE
ncbi:MAG TPA: hypothetical protein VIF83_08165 [Gemmatimonadaceae bacterium]|jgi:hypothetical protein